MNLEVLEGRDTPASVFVSDGVLFIDNADFGSSTQIYREGNLLKVVSVDTEGYRTLFFDATAVSRIDYSGGAGTDSYFNLTNIPETVDAGAGNDSVVTGTGAGSIVNAGAGRDFVAFLAQSGAVNTADGEADFLFVLNKPATVSVFDPGLDFVF